MPGFLFWNLKNKPLQREVAALARERAADIIVLAEYGGTDVEMLAALGNSSFEAIPVLGCERLRIFAAVPKYRFAILEERSHFTIQRLVSPRNRSLTVVAVHLQSKLHRTPEDQLTFAMKVICPAIQEVEKREGHSRTLVLGDFNMNPFENGMTNCAGFNAVMSRELAFEGQRIVDGLTYEYFYNPMWKFLSDLTPGPPGTIFYRTCYKSLFWNLYDQVLLRPSLIPSFSARSLMIPTEVAGQSLLKSNRPNKADYSDHLPLFFRLKLRKGA